MDLDKLWQRVYKALRSKQFRSGKISQADLDSFVAEESQGAYTSVDELKSALAARDVVPGMAEGIARSAHQGLTFGFGEELAGALAALGGGNYAETRDLEREANRAFRGAHPKVAMASEIAGSLPTALLFPGGGAAEMGLGQLAARGAATGAIAGGVAGAGYSEAQDPLAVALDALKGAGAGGIAGGVIGGAARPIARGVAAVPRFLQDVFAPDAAAERRAVEGLAGVLPAEAGARAAEMEAVRPGMGTPADVGPGMGRALRASANRSMDVGEQAAEQLGARSEDAGARMARDLLEQAGVPQLDVPEIKVAAKRAIPALREKLFGPLDQLYGNLDVSTLPSTSGVQMEGKPVSDVMAALLLDPQAERVYRQVQAELSQAPQTHTFRALQATVQRLNEAAESAWQAPGGQARAIEISRARDNLIAALEEALPGYKAANQGYASTMSTIRAFDDGAKAMLEDSRNIPGLLERARKSGGEEAVSAFRMGGLDKVAQDLRIMSTSRDAARRMATMGPEIEARLGALFPNAKALEAFLRRAKVERMFERTYRATQGNSTTVQQAEDIARITGSPPAIGGRSMLDRATEYLGEAVYGNLPEKAARVAGQRLLTTGPKMRAVLAELEAARQSLLSSRSAIGTYGGTRIPFLAGEAAGSTRRP